MARHFLTASQIIPMELSLFLPAATLLHGAFFFNSHLGENTVTLFLDDWFINERLCEHADYFVLWGMSYGATFEEDEIIFAMGSRFGAGLDFFLLSRRLEIFGQAVWNPYFGFKKEDGDYSPLFRPVNFPCSAGLRLWF